MKDSDIKWLLHQKGYVYRYEYQDIIDWFRIEHQILIHVACDSKTTLAKKDERQVCNFNFSGVAYTKNHQLIVTKYYSEYYDALHEIIKSVLNTEIEPKDLSKQSTFQSTIKKQL